MVQNAGVGACVVVNSWVWCLVQWLILGLCALYMTPPSALLAWVHYVGSTTRRSDVVNLWFLWLVLLTIVIGALYRMPPSALVASPC